MSYSYLLEQLKLKKTAVTIPSTGKVPNTLALLYRAHESAELSTATLGNRQNLKSYSYIYHILSHPVARFLPREPKTYVHILVHKCL